MKSVMFKAIFILFAVLHISVGNEQKLLKEFENEISRIVDDEKETISADLLEAAVEIKKSVSKVVHDLSKSLDKLTGIQSDYKRPRRGIDLSGQLKVVPRFGSIVNFFTCKSLSSVMFEFSSGVGETLLTISRVLNSTSNFTASVNMCDGNPFCLMSRLVLVTPLFSEVANDLIHLYGALRIRLERTAALVLACIFRPDENPEPVENHSPEIMYEFKEDISDESSLSFARRNNDERPRKLQTIR